jgi:NAD+ diphosphatase
MTQTLQPAFTQSPLDRMDHLRPAIGARLLAGPHPANRFLLFSGAGVLRRGADGRFLLTEAELAAVPHDRSQAVFLGGAGETLYFALDAAPDLGAAFETLDLREVVNRQLLPDAELGLLAQASSVLQWHRTHGFCGRCGARSVPANGGWRRDCPACKAQHFPRVDPVVIMLVTHGGQCLLGCGHNFASRRMYACLAGFLEPGETIEAAARRELFEEAGLAARSVSYLFSQPWPYPSSLMIGLRVEAEDMAFTMDEKELRDLKWVSREEVRAVLEGATDRDFTLPSRVAIARDLLEAWVASPE